MKARILLAVLALFSNFSFAESQEAWKEEPTTFIGIEMNKPLIQSVDTECPKNTRKIGGRDIKLPDYAAMKNLPEDKKCYLEPDGNMIKNLEVYNLKIKGLASVATNTTSDGSINGMATFRGLQLNTQALITVK